MSIKRGEWSIGKVKKEANGLLEAAQEAYDRSTLPPLPDYEAAERLLLEIMLH